VNIAAEIRFDNMSFSSRLDDASTTRHSCG
jgi:hypothetical protein